MEGDEGSSREGGGALMLARCVMAQILVTPNLDNNVLSRRQTQTDRGVILFTKQMPKIEKGQISKFEKKFPPLFICFVGIFCTKTQHGTFHFND